MLQGSPDGALAGAAGSLVSTRDKSAKGCPNPVLGLRFQHASGELSPIPCNRSTCPVCSRRQSMVTATMVGLNAQLFQPRLVSTFTTRDRIEKVAFRRAAAQIIRQVRSEFPRVEYCSFLEFTTGKGFRSGGVRRPHSHTLWTGIPPSGAPVVSAIAANVLERTTGAYRQEVEEIRTPAGATMYVASHHLKESQAPPAWWGPTRRVRPSKGWWRRPSPELRQEASGIVKAKRLERYFKALHEDRWFDEKGRPMPVDILEAEVIEPAVIEALAAPPPRVVRVSRPWEDPLGA